MKRISLKVWTTAASIAASAAIAQAQCQYTVQEWGTVDCGIWGPTSWYSNAINNLGGWAGYRLKCDPGTGTLPVYCAPDGEPQVLPLPSSPGPVGAQALCLNDLGDVGGFFRQGPTDTDTAYIWWHDGTVTVIPPPPGGDRSYVYGINNSGLAVGQRFSPSPGKPFAWKDGMLTEIETTPFDRGFAEDVSNTGYATGYLGSANINARAFRWKDGVTTILEPLPGHTVSIGEDVNDAGTVCGRSRKVIGSAPDEWRAVLWRLDGSIEVLPSPPGMPNTFALALNDAEIVAGQASAQEAPWTGVIWIAGNVFLVSDLPLVGGGFVSDVTELNDVGQLLRGGSALILTPNLTSPADLDGDCSVNGADVAKLLAEWGPREWSVADVNGDGAVNGFDLAIVLGEWSGSR